MPTEESELVEQEGELNPTQMPNFPRGIALINRKFFGYPVITEDAVYGFSIFSPEYDSHDRIRMELGKYWVQFNPNETPAFYAPHGHTYNNQLGAFYRDWFRKNIRKDVNYTDFMGNEGVSEPWSPGIIFDSPSMIYDGWSAPRAEQSIQFRLNVDGVATQSNINDLFQSWQGLFLGSSWSETFDSKPLIELGYPYEDYQLTLELPFSKMEIDESDSINELVTSSVAIESNYNYRYFFDDYLVAISYDEIAESFLPSLYQLMATNEPGFAEMWMYLGDNSKLANLIDAALFKIVNNITDQSLRDKYSTIFDRIEGQMALVALGLTPAAHNYRVETCKTIARMFGIWFDKLVSRGLIKTYNDNTDDYNQIRNKFRNIAFTNSARHLLQQTTISGQDNAFNLQCDDEFSSDCKKLPYSSIFPMSINIDLSSTNSEKYDLYNVLKLTGQEYASYFDGEGPSTNTDYVSAITFIQQKVMEKYSVPTPAGQKSGENALDNYSSTQAFVQTRSDASNVKENVAKNVWDVTNLIHGLETKGSQIMNFNNADYCTFYTTEEIDINDPASDLVTQDAAAGIRQKIYHFFSSQFQSVSSADDNQKWFRTYEDILRGKFSKSELLFWRIEKSTTGSSGEVEAVQHIYVLNSPDLDIAHYVDTQVKYSKDYFYKIYAYYGVGATRYIYQDINFGIEGPGTLISPLAPAEVVEVDECFDSEGGPVPCEELNLTGGDTYQNLGDVTDGVSISEGLSVTKSTVKQNWSTEWSQAFWNKFAQIYEDNLILLYQDLASWAAGNTGGVNATPSPPTYLQTAQILNMPIHGIEHQPSSWIRQFFGLSDSDPVGTAAMEAVVQYGLNYGSGFNDMWSWLCVSGGTILSMADINAVADNEWTTSMQGIGHWAYTLRFFTKIKVEMINFVINSLGESVSAYEAYGVPNLGPGSQGDVFDEIGDGSSAAMEEEGVITVDDQTKAVLVANVLVSLAARLKIIEVPYLNVSPSWPSLVLDRPPGPPSVDIVPYSGNPNEVLMLFDETSGNHTSTPIIILQEDAEIFRRHSVAQGVKNGEPIEFGNDNAVTDYQIFRLTSPPASYDSYSFTTPTQAGGKSFLDKLQPNKKYFYMFRSIDARGNVSNPSSVYEVELVTLEDGNSSSKQAVLPIIKPYNFPDISLGNATRDFRKYLLIEPASHQAAINSIEANQINFGIPLQEGGSLKSIFTEKDSQEGRRFKLRITSKKTGRKMDLNFQFKQKHEVV